MPRVLLPAAKPKDSQAANLITCGGGGGGGEARHSHRHSRGRTSSTRRRSHHGATHLADSGLPRRSISVVVVPAAAAAEAAATGTNNSMPMADKAYDAPEPPEDIEAYLPGLAEEAIKAREAVRPVRRNYITMYFRVRRRNYEQLLWQFCTSGIVAKDRMYQARCLPFWTVGMRVRVRINYPLGRVIDTMKCRLGITNPGLRFCLDGFFGMMNYTDIFGNTVDVCPWMEISICSTVTSLRLRDGDSIFISIATAAQIENVMKWRKRHAIEALAAQDGAQNKKEAESAGSEGRSNVVGETGAVQVGN